MLLDGRLVSGESDGIRLWDQASRRQLARLEGHSGWVMRSRCYPTDASPVASSGVDGTIRVWDPANGLKFASLEGHREPVHALAVLPDGRLVSGGHDGIRLWDPAGGRQLAHLEGHEDTISALAALPDGRLVSRAQDKTIRLWDPGVRA